VPTTAGCPAYSNTPEKTAPVVAMFEQAGARAIGKTNLDQFATGLVGVRSPYGACVSVFNPEYISGGSSSGSAVAVASGQVDFSLGTDTAGSGRVPAAFNNIYGLKPTKGILSTVGVVPACASLDCVSIFTRDVRTAQRVFEAANPRKATPAWANGPFRFGVPAAEHLQFFGDDAAAALYQSAIKKLEAAGGQRVEIDYVPFRDTAQLLYSGPWVAERYVAVGGFLEGHPNDAHPVVKNIILGGKNYSAADTFKAMYKLEEYKAETLRTWESIDVMLLPTTGTTYKISEVEADPVKLNSNLGYYTNFVNLLDLAALAIPAGFRPNGLPFGVTLIGQAHTDWALLDLAARLEEVKVTVVGAHLTGQPLNKQLTERGARLLKTCKTAKDYRLYGLANTNPLGWGMRQSGLARFLAGSQVYDIVGMDRSQDVEILSTYVERDVLQSGWLLGEQVIAKKAAAVAVNGAAPGDGTRVHGRPSLWMGQSWPRRNVRCSISSSFSEKLLKDCRPPPMTPTQLFSR